VIVLLSVREWVLLLARRTLATLHETEPVWLPVYAVAEAKPLHLFSLFALGIALAKELSGEATLDRAKLHNTNPCGCHLRDAQSNEHAGKIDLLGNQYDGDQRRTEQQLYLDAIDRRFSKINRCC